MKQTSTIRNLYTYVLWFVMSLTLTFTVALAVSSLTFFSPTSFSDSIVFVKYDERSAELAKQEAVEIGLLYGVEQKVMERLDIDQYAKQVAYIQYPNNISEKLTIELSLLKSDVLIALQDYALTQGLSLTQEVQFGINEMAYEVVDVIKSAITIPLHQSFFKLIETFQKFYYPLIVIMMIVLVIQQQILYRLDRRNHSRNIGYMLLMSGWMMILVPGVLLLGGFYRQILIFPDYFRDLLIRHFEVTLWGALFAGGLLLVAGCISSLLYLRKTKAML